MNQAHADGYSLCVDVLANLSNDAHYREWVGTFTAQRLQTVRDTFAGIRDRMEFTTFTYILTGVGCQSGLHAYTFKSETRIWTCEPFWSSPATGMESKAGTVLHEHSHATAGTDDIRYGEGTCRQLAIDDPNRAVRNAANYAYFAES
jgi:peptidyl-Lys metalloendopeptidase